MERWKSQKRISDRNPMEHIGLTAHHREMDFALAFGGADHDRGAFGRARLGDKEA